MNPVEEEYQARRAEEWAQQDLPNITPAPVLNRGRGRWQSKFYLTSANVLQNLEDAILDLHRHQLTQQQQRTTQGHREVEVEREMSASKVRWPELSQLSLCSEFDKENSMGFSLNSLLLIHFTTVAMHLFSHGPHVTLVMWHTVTVTCDMTICDHPSHHCDKVMWYFPTLHLVVVNKKRKEI